MKIKTAVFTALFSVAMTGLALADKHLVVRQLWPISIVFPARRILPSYPDELMAPLHFAHLFSLRIKYPSVSRRHKKLSLVMHLPIDQTNLSGAEFFYYAHRLKDCRRHPTIFKVEK